MDVEGPQGNLVFLHDMYFPAGVKNVTWDIAFPLYQECKFGDPLRIFVGARCAYGGLIAVVTTGCVVGWFVTLALLGSGELLVLLFSLGDRG